MLWNAANRGRMEESIGGVIHINDGYWTRRSSRAWVAAKRNPTLESEKVQLTVRLEPHLVWVLQTTEGMTKGLLL